MKKILTATAAFALLLIFSCAPKNVSPFSKIEYEATACFGFCPVFKMQINPDGTAIVEAEHFTFTDGKDKDEFSKPNEGTFTTTLKAADYKTLLTLINEAEVQRLEPEYGSQNISDLPTSYLNITFKDGNFKKIKDYGKNGTPKLRAIYKFIESLPKTQTWIKVK